MATGILSKGIVMAWNHASVWTELTDLQEVPDLGASVSKVEVTTLADSAKRYINGIKDYGDLEFKFLYSNGTNSSFRTFSGFETANSLKEYRVTLPDNTAFKFSGYVTTKLDGAGVEAPLTFTASIALNTDITIINPA